MNSANKELEKLAKMQNHGGPMSPLRVEACRWASNQLSKASIQPHLQTTPEGWPIHPTLKIKPDYPAGQIELAWTQNGESIQSLRESWENILIWPGSDTVTSLAKHIFGTREEEEPNSTSRLFTFKLLCEEAKIQFGEETLSTIQKTRGSIKDCITQFLLSNLPETPNERKNILRNRIQLARAHPGLIAASSQIPEEFDKEFLLQQSKKETSSHSLTPAYNLGAHSPNLKKLQAAVDQGTPLPETLKTIFPGLTQHGTKSFLAWTKLFNTRKRIQNHVTELIQARWSAILEMLKASIGDPKEHAVTQRTIERSSQRVEALLTSLEKNPKATWFRIQEIEASQSPYEKIRSTKTSWGNNQILHTKIPIHQLREDFLQAEQIFTTLLEWETLHIGKTLEKKLTTAEAKKPEEDRHEIAIPDPTHIRDYLIEKYPQKIPTNLSYEKLCDQIRRWDHFTAATTKDLLEAENKEIPQQTLEHFPQFEIPGYTTKLLTCSHDFAKEGNHQKHCVAGYFSRASEGLLAIYSVQDNSTHWTAEVNHKYQLKQFRGHKNKQAPTALRSLFEKTLAAAAKEKKKKNRTSQIKPQGALAKLPAHIREKIQIEKPSQPGTLIQPEGPHAEQIKEWIAAGAHNHSRYYAIIEPAGPKPIEIDGQNVYTVHLKSGFREKIFGPTITSKEHIPTTEGNLISIHFELNTRTKKVLLTETLHGETNTSHHHIHPYKGFPTESLNIAWKNPLTPEGKEIAETFLKSNLDSAFINNINKARKRKGIYQTTYIITSPKEAAQILQDYQSGTLSPEDIAQLGETTKQTKAAEQRAQEIPKLEEATAAGKILLRARTEKTPQGWVPHLQAKEEKSPLLESYRATSRFEIAVPIPEEARARNAQGAKLDVHEANFRWISAVNTLEALKLPVRKPLQKPRRTSVPLPTKIEDIEVAFD